MSPTLLFANPYERDSFPILANVINVANNDVLNIRIDPDPSSEILGVLPPDASDIELVDHDPSGRWGLVNSNEVSGWVRLTYLHAAKQAKWHAFQTPLRCGGTEPFWSLTINQTATKAVFEDFHDPARPYGITWTSDIHARLGGTMGLGAGDTAAGFSAVINNEMCNDGMSDREYALQLHLFIHNNGHTAGYEGCCSLAP
ncbi:SH3 domain-containing protein [Cognatishimia sp. WU-CL00825]|uniref:SH3 domain-containing protein n=1 Tax=Cognatishimia sp. WU-CL00825 TaxID=3127658 RepID=UPI003365939D